MTRINVVPVETLSDKHLLAEYKEITRPFNKVTKRIAAGTMEEVSIPAKYCLGKGHETFFFNKLSWLMARYLCLHAELRARGFNVDGNKFFLISEGLTGDLQGTTYWGDYTPTPEDMYLNMARLAKRSKMPSVLAELQGDT